jgi:hypothetical protein
MATLAIQSTSLETLEMFDSDLERAPKLVQCTKLSTIKLNRCKKLTDKKVQYLLRQWSPQDENMPNSQEDEGNDSQNSRKSPLPVQNIQQTLRKLYFTECEPISNPYVISLTLTDLRFINCRLLHNPMITCPALRNLQLSWCENLENLTLGCDQLQTLDLTGAGINMSHTQSSQDGTNPVRESILAAIKSHFGDQVTVSY